MDYLLSRSFSLMSFEEQDQRKIEDKDKVSIGNNSFYCFPCLLLRGETVWALPGTVDLKQQLL